MAENNGLFANEVKDIGSVRNRRKRKGSLKPTTLQEPVETVEAEVADPQPTAAEANMNVVPAGTPSVGQESSAELVTGQVETPAATPETGETDKKGASALKYQIRFPGDTRNKLDALMALRVVEGTQYEVLGAIVDSFIENNLSETDRMLVERLIEANKDKYIH